MPDLKLIIPLGKTVEDTFLTLYPEYEPLVLRGLPHPSGVNAHRRQIFATNFDFKKSSCIEFSCKKIR